MNTKFYIPIKSVNLGHYYNKACICPVRFLNERNEDIQNIFNEFILLSSTKFVNDSNCSIEIVLTDEEKNIYVEKLYENFFLLKLFIPITRIVAIHFNNKEQSEKTIWNIEQGRAFVPKNIIFYDLDNSRIEFNRDIITKNFKNEFDAKNKINLDKFNRLLGGFALMRLGGDSFMNYSLNYFTTLANINSIIKKEIENANKDGKLPVQNKFDWLILNNKSNFEELYKLTYSNVSINDLEKFASKNNIRIDKKLGKINLDTIDKQSTTFLVAILASYSDIGARLTIDNFISDLTQNKFPITRKEGISLMFGINKGYEAFRNIYSTETFTAKIKFEMDSPIDYYVIESTYQFIINNKISEKLYYLQSYMPSGIVLNSNIKFKTYTILNCEIIYEKKPVSIGEVISSFLNRIFFSEFSNPLVKNFEKTIGLNLTKEQSAYKSIEFEKLLKDPLKQCVDNLKVEVESFYDDKLVELKHEISKSQSERQKLSDLLKTIDKDVFIKLDNDSDNLLNYDQIAEFVNIIKSKPNNHIKNYPTIEKQKSTFSVTIQHEKTGDLFATQESTINYEENKIQADRKKQLNKLGITALKNEATKVGIKSVSRFKNTTEDKENLIKLILKKEQH